ncbi:hypothetical protein Spla01_05339 [Streptomyces platensis]|nr:hypothetical protein Srufu_031770 [Streptomyces libani subsp. rufus]
MASCQAGPLRDCVLLAIEAQGFGRPAGAGGQRELKRRFAKTQTTAITVATGIIHHAPANETSEES